MLEGGREAVRFRLRSDLDETAREEVLAAWCELLDERFEPKPGETFEDFVLWMDWEG